MARSRDRIIDILLSSKSNEELNTAMLKQLPYAMLDSRLDTGETLYGILTEFRNDRVNIYRFNVYNSVSNVPRRK